MSAPAKCPKCGLVQMRRSSCKACGAAMGDPTLPSPIQPSIGAEKHVVSRFVSKWPWQARLGVAIVAGLALIVFTIRLLTPPGGERSLRQKAEAFLNDYREGNPLNDHASWRVRSEMQRKGVLVNLIGYEYVSGREIPCENDPPVAGRDQDIYEIWKKNRAGMGDTWEDFVAEFTGCDDPTWKFQYQIRASSRGGLPLTKRYLVVVRWDRTKDQAKVIKFEDMHGR